VNVFSDLPAVAMEYVRRIEDILRVGTRIVPIGPKHRWVLFVEWRKTGKLNVPHILLVFV
jgi:adenylosuccinate synthase